MAQRVTSLHSPGDLRSVRPHWLDLPTEVRLMILEEVADRHSQRFTRRTGLARYACVCEEWQAFFEEKTFHHFILEDEDLQKFEEFVGLSRRMFVKHIWLRIKLDRHPDVATHNIGFAATLSRLVAHVPGDAEGPWDLDPQPRHAILEDWIQSDYLFYEKYLENGSLAAYKHQKDHHTRCGYLRSVIRPLMPNIGPLTDRESHYWACWRDWESHIFGTRLLVPDDMNSVPIVYNMVPVVTKFLIRRQNYREFKPDALQKILGHFPCLEECSRAATLKKLCLFSNTGGAFDMPPFDGLSVQRQPSTLRPRSNVARSLVAASVELEHLSVAFFTSARAFFAKAIKPAFFWSNLRSLSLTETTFAHEALGPKDQDDKTRIANFVIAQAALTALKMPKLQVMELWNGKKGSGNIFRYQATELTTEIAWLGTEPIEFTNDVIQAWQFVARQREWSDGRDLVQSVTQLSPSDFPRTGSILSYLKIDVLHPVSAYKFELENDEDLDPEAPPPED
ncbi:hypothetical protein G7046_g6956 [Stylonectria norvegica]|nr:hypothetical protein G7046_g6956 [Stylonectria norvegica]